MSNATVTWDEETQMWLAEAVDRKGRYHRKWFHREDSAKKWAKHWENKG